MDKQPDPETIDPGNQLLWRQRLRRLESEVVRDAVLATSGKLDRSFGGPSVPVESRPDGSIVIRESELPTPSARWRRSLYIMARRNYHLSMLGVFDQPIIATNCTRRAPSAVVLQSLAMLNDDFVVEQARYFADRVAAGPTQDQWVKSAFALALSRGPTSEETAWCQDLLARQFDRYRPQSADDAAAHREALVHLCHMLLNTSEFLYVE